MTRHQIGTSSVERLLQSWPLLSRFVACHWDWSWLPKAAGFWFTDHKQKGLINILQITQNEACRKAAGVFRTTPNDLVHTLVSIPPIRYRLRHLLRNATDRLSRLPPSHSLRNPQRNRKTTSIPRYEELDHIIPPPISYPIFVTPPKPSSLKWSHERFMLKPKTPDAKIALRSKNVTKIFLHNSPFHIPG
jgi:hypothetical protein